jgi:hypothetical protein
MVKETLLRIVGTFFLYLKFSFLKLIVAYVVLVTFIFRNHRVFNNEMPFLISPSEYL